MTITREDNRKLLGMTIKSALQVGSVVAAFTFAGGCLLGPQGILFGGGLSSIITYLFCRARDDDSR